jgi:hypothetical protein
MKSTTMLRKELITLINCNEVDYRVAQRLPSDNIILICAELGYINMVRDHYFFAERHDKILRKCIKGHQHELFHYIMRDYPQIYSYEHASAAAKYGNLVAFECAGKLLSIYCDILAFTAAKNRHLHILKFLTEKGFSGAVITQIHIVCCMCDTETVKYILDLGAIIPTYTMETLRQNDQYTILEFIKSFEKNIDLEN